MARWNQRDEFGHFISKAEYERSQSGSDNQWEFLPNDWSSYEKDLWGGTFGNQVEQDRVAQALFNEGYFNFDITSDQISAIRNALDDYLLDTYGIDFDEQFDWEAYREAYGELT
jgi:hypothetical protein